MKVPSYLEVIKFLENIDPKVLVLKLDDLDKSILAMLLRRYIEDQPKKMNKLSLLALEKYMIPFAEWDSCSAPQECKDIAYEEHNSGYSAGIGYHESTGWFVLVSAGQGPCLSYSER